jgi:hypothetical protein
MKKTFLLNTLFFLCLFPVKAQTEEKQIIDVIDRFFVSMTERDSATAAEILTPDGQYYGTHRNGDKLEVFRVTHESYLSRLSKRKEEVLERYWNPTIHVEGPIAQVWAEYDFYINGVFSHCGVDAFSLIQVEGKWKICGVIFNMETEGCPESPLGKP